MKFGILLAGIPALLCSTAVFAQDDSHPYFGLSLTGGVTALALPSGQNGVQWDGDAVVTGGNADLALGGTLNLSTGIGLGKIGDYDAFMGVSIFGTYANGYSALTQEFSGVGMVYIPGLQTPDDVTINLTTSRNQAGPGPATAGATIVGNAVDSSVYGIASSAATAGPADGGQSDADVSTGAPTSFVMSGTNTEIAGGVATALAYGAMADASGSVFLAVGDLDGLSIATSVQNSIIYAGGDITFGASGTPDEDTIVQAYAGPSYRYIGQWNNMQTALSVDIPEVGGSGVTHPLYIVDRDATVSSNYFGGIFGGNVSHRVSDTVSIAFGGEAGLYYAGAYLSGSETVTTTGGIAPGPIPSPTVTVVGDPVSVYEGALAYAVRGQTSATVALSPSIDLTASLSVDYLSHVARPVGGGTVSYSNDGTNANASFASGGTLISFGDMWAFTGALTVTGHF